jgi:excisionase family DNA binding protein
VTVGPSRMTDSDVERTARAFLRLLRAERLDGPEPEFLTPADLAKRLSLSPRKVWDMLSRGTIPSYKFEGARRVRRSDVEDYERARRGATSLR